MSDEGINIFKRFASVFGQTYRRYLDLKKAEAQAREAQIEAALEKVRSRSLAMHKTDELQEVVTVVLDRMTDLNTELDTINLNIFNSASKELNLWTAAPHQKYAIPFHLPFFNHSFHTDIFTAREQGLDFFTKTYSLVEKYSYFHHTFEHSDFRHVPENKKKLILESTVLKNSLSAEKVTPAAKADLCNRTIFDDLTSRKASAYPEKIRFRVFQQNRPTAVGRPPVHMSLQWRLRILKQPAMYQGRMGPELSGRQGWQQG